MRELKKKDLTYVGTVKKNKAEIPLAFLPNKRRTVESSEFGFTNDMTLVSFLCAEKKQVSCSGVIYASQRPDWRRNQQTRNNWFL